MLQNRSTRRIEHPFYGSIQIFEGPDAISDHVASGREWEPHVAEAIASSIRPGDELIDVGANLGLITMGILARTGTLESIHCFEPRPDAMSILQDNLARFSPRIQTYAFGLMDEAGDHAYRETHENVGATRLGVLPSEHRCAALTLDQVSARWPVKTSVMKIDVEMCESKLLFGARTYFARARPRAVFVEIFDEYLPSVRGQLEEMGYVLHRRLGGWDYQFLPRASR